MDRLTKILMRVLELRTDAPERSQLLREAALREHRIVAAPCAVTGVPRPDGARHTLRANAHGEHEVQRRAPSAANSSQLLLRSFETSWWQPRSSSSVSGCGAPLGWLPALKAWKRLLPQRASAHSAIRLRAEFRVPTNKVLEGIRASVDLASWISTGIDLARTIDTCQYRPMPIRKQSISCYAPVLGGRVETAQAVGAGT